MYCIGFIQRPYKLNNVSGKMIHPATIDQGFAVP